MSSPTHKCRTGFDAPHPVQQYHSRFRTLSPTRICRVRIRAHNRLCVLREVVSSETLWSSAFDIRAARPNCYCWACALLQQIVLFRNTAAQQELAEMLESERSHLFRFGSQSKNRNNCIFKASIFKFQGPNLEFE